MSIRMFFGRLIAALTRSRPATINTDTMCLNDWADLPAHHPARDSAPR